jgi:ribose-phosphate pyrophosphokinase
MKTIIISTNDNCKYGQVLAKKLKAPYVFLPSNRYRDNELVHYTDFFKNVITFERVIIVCSDGSITGDERIMRVVFIAHELKKRGINNIALIMPYLPYSREINIFGATVLQLFANAGIQKLFCMQMHEKLSSSIDGVSVYNIDAAAPIADDIKKRLPLNEVILCSPDKGVKVLIQHIAQLLEAPFVCADKIRDKDGTVINLTCKEPVNRKYIIIIDDIISTGSTFRQMMAALQIQQKDYCLYGYMVHGVFANGVKEALHSKRYHSLAISHSLFITKEHGSDFDYRYFDTADYFTDQIIAKLEA